MCYNSAMSHIAFSANAGANPVQVDTLLTNGIVITMDDAFTQFARGGSSEERPRIADFDLASDGCEPPCPAWIGAADQERALETAAGQRDSIEAIGELPFEQEQRRPRDDEFGEPEEPEAFQPSDESDDN